MVTLLQQTSSEVAGKQGSTVLINAITEVLTGDADVVSLPVLKVFVFDVAPLLHEFHASTSVLAGEGSEGLQLFH